MELKFQDVKTFLETQKENAEVKRYLDELKKPNPEIVSAFLETEEGKKFIQPRLDKYFTKGLETWKEKTLPEIIEAEIKKRFPAETEEQKRIRKLEEELNKEKQARMRELLRNKAHSLMIAKKLPIELADFFIGNDETSTEENISKLEKVWTEEIKKSVEAVFRNGGRAPEQGAGTPPDIDTLILKAESEKNWKEAIRLKNLKLAKLPRN